MTDSRTPTEPLRHQASARNRRKALHHGECALLEIEHIRAELARMDDKCRYAVGRLHRIINRLRTEAKADEETAP